MFQISNIIEEIFACFVIEPIKELQYELISTLVTRQGALFISLGDGNFVKKPTWRC